MLWRGAADWPEFGTGRSMVIASGTAAKLVICPIAAGRPRAQSSPTGAPCLKGRQPGDPPQRQELSCRADPTELAGRLGRFQGRCVRWRRLSDLSLPASRFAEELMSLYEQTVLCARDGLTGRILSNRARMTAGMGLPHRSTRPPALRELGCTRRRAGSAP